MSMISDRVKKGIMGIVFSFILLLSSGMVLGTTAQAQDQNRDPYWQQDRNDHRDRDRQWRRDRNRDRYRNGGSYQRGYPPYGSNGRYGRYGDGSGYNNVAEQNGYRVGLERGIDDARHGRSYNPNNSSHYRDGDSGYHSQYGSKDAYKAAYRDGFSRGYDEGYRQNGGNRRW